MAFHALLRPLLGRGDALLAVLAALCLTYATDRLPIYNHNVVMMPFIAASSVMSPAWVAKPAARA